MSFEGYLPLPPGRYGTNLFPPNGHYGALPCGGGAFGPTTSAPSPYGYPRGSTSHTPFKGWEVVGGRGRCRGSGLMPGPGQGPSRGGLSYPLGRVGLWLVMGRRAAIGDVTGRWGRDRMRQYILHTILIQSFDSLPGFAGRGDLVRCWRQDRKCRIQ